MHKCNLLVSLLNQKADFTNSSKLNIPCSSHSELS